MAMGIQPHQNGANPFILGKSYLFLVNVKIMKPFGFDKLWNGEICLMLEVLHNNEFY